MAGEFEIIARHFAPIAGEAGLGLLDDAALLKPLPGHDLVVTTDALSAGVHFFPDDPPETIGHKALAVNLSDLAAKGADPLGFLLSLMLPVATPDVWLAGFTKGISNLATLASCPLIGGDTITTKGPLGLSITALGTLPSGQIVRRNAAQPGDRLVLTGTIGDAALGLLERIRQREGKPSSLADDHRDFLIERYLLPRPRYVAAELVRRYARAAMDISDGLIGDLTKLVRLSGYGAKVYLDDVPHSVAARAAFRLDPTLRERALTGGDDYEILSAVPAKHVAPFMAACLKLGLASTIIGIVEEDAGLHFLDGAGKEHHFKTSSYVHALD